MKFWTAFTCCQLFFKMRGVIKIFIALFGNKRCFRITFLLLCHIHTFSTFYIIQVLPKQPRLILWRPVENNLGNFMLELYNYLVGLPIPRGQVKFSECKISKISWDWGWRKKVELKKSRMKFQKKWILRLQIECIKVVIAKTLSLLCRSWQSLNFSHQS